MTQEIDVNSWEEFEHAIAKMKSLQEGDNRLMPYLLFRGQSDANWELQTTLERACKEEMTFDKYYRKISVLQPEIETFTSNRWENPPYPQLVEEFRKYDFMRFNQHVRTSIYGYMAHLRHHGFPSPLLDWTRSPYVAAYFAFSRTSLSDRVSIYVLSQATMRSRASNEPEIFDFGPRVRTHRRHFLQQCEYSMCASFSTNEWRFVGHEEAGTDMQKVEDHPYNIGISKITIPVTERLKVLGLLDVHNINAFSLFGSEEGLMQTLALREFFLRPER